MEFPFLYHRTKTERKQYQSIVFWIGPNREKQLLSVWPVYSVYLLFICWYIVCIVVAFGYFEHFVFVNAPFINTKPAMIESFMVVVSQQ